MSDDLVPEMHDVGKLIDKSIMVKGHTFEHVAERHPLKQGLKPARVTPEGKIYRGRRATSNKTRIETKSIRRIELWR